MDERPRNLKAMLSEAKDLSETMVDIAYASVYFGLILRTSVKVSIRRPISLANVSCGFDGDMISSTPRS